MESEPVLSPKNIGNVITNLGILLPILEKFLKIEYQNNKNGLLSNIKFSINGEDLERGFRTTPSLDISRTEIEVSFDYHKSYDIEPTKTYVKSIITKFSFSDMQGNIKYFSFRVDYDEESSSPFPHPTWHIQLNFREYNHISEELPFVFPNTPRFFSYPMDVILFLDFIISHAIPNKKQILEENYGNDWQYYIALLKVHQKYFWKPFFEKIYNYLNDGSSKEEAQKFLPSLI